MQRFKKNLGEELLTIFGGLLGAVCFLSLVGLITYLLTIAKKTSFSL